MDATVAIIGAGPAGISAGVMLARYGIDSVIYEANKVGGLIENAYRVDNTMLYPSGIKGMDFVKILEKYVEKYDLEVVKGEIKKVKVEDAFVLEPMKRRYRYLIVATGTRPRKLPFRGVYYHVVDIKDDPENALIIGEGDIALDYALSLSERAKNVTVLYRSKIRAIPSLVKEVKKRKNVNLVKGEIVSVEDEIKTTAGVMSADTIIGAIGRIPNIEIVDGITSPRMFLIGDVKNGIYRQTSLAIADGIRAAMKIWRCNNGDSC